MRRDRGWRARSTIPAGERSRYAGYQSRPWQWEPAGLAVRAGLAIAVLDGYPQYQHGGAFVTPLPLIAVEGRTLGVNLTVFPSIDDRVKGAIALQIKLRVRSAIVLEAQVEAEGRAGCL